MNASQTLSSNSVQVSAINNSLSVSPIQQQQLQQQQQTQQQIQQSQQSSQSNQGDLLDFIKKYFVILNFELIFT